MTTEPAPIDPAPAGNAALQLIPTQDMLAEIWKRSDSVFYFIEQTLDDAPDDMAKELAQVQQAIRDKLRACGADAHSRPVLAASRGKFNHPSKPMALLMASLNASADSWRDFSRAHPSFLELDKLEDDEERALAQRVNFCGNALDVFMGFCEQRIGPIMALIATLRRAQSDMRRLNEHIAKLRQHGDEAAQELAGYEEGRVALTDILNQIINDQPT